MKGCGKVDFVPRKPRSKEEIEAIVADAESGVAPIEICEKYAISETAFYTLLRAYRGMPPKDYRKEEEKKSKKLEKKLAERERERVLLKEILKKS